ncbi:hypothetical protein GSS87_01420 [Corynebacterium sp. 4HC-13]|uniref:hypothetical protein n=1 Tax=Corynebacterium anserum TaxID=2684406 RepID=UPI0016398BF0|nr:hypothetical protein [Corynebacterium anserum]MBC2681085.1 hypothetical protein [Corynebacterium anserum]
MTSWKPLQSPDDYVLPASSWKGTGLKKADYVSVMRHSLPILARSGTAISSQSLHEIGNAVGVSPSCPLLRHPQRLYEEGLRFAMAQIWPPADAPELDGLADLIPADAVRNFVSATFRRFQAHPDCLRLLIAENLFNTLDLPRRVGVMEDSPVVLQLDRLLMRGYDVGAFREGISAEDLYVVILSLCAFPVASGSTFHALYGMNVSDPANAEGLEKLIVDNVVAFLTSTMPTSQGSSYTHSSQSPGMGSSVAAHLYSREYAELNDATGPLNGVSTSPSVTPGSFPVSSHDATAPTPARSEHAPREEELYGKD